MGTPGLGLGQNFLNGLIKEDLSFLDRWEGQDCILLLLILGVHWVCRVGRQMEGVMISIEAMVQP